MGDYLLLALPALGLLSIPFVAIWLQKRKTGEPYTEDADFCPKCHHSDGLDERSEHCDDVSDDGWGLTECQCVNDFHWRTASARRNW